MKNKKQQIIKNIKTIFYKFIGCYLNNKKEFTKLNINGQTHYCKNITEKKSCLVKFASTLKKILMKMKILTKQRYYVEFQFCTKDCKVDYLFPNFFEVTDRKELISLIKQTRNSIEEVFDVVSNSKPNPNIKNFNDTRYEGIYMTHVKTGNLKYLTLKEYQVKTLEGDINKNYDFKVNNPEFVLGDYQLNTTYNKLKDKKLPVRVLNNKTGFNDYPFHLVVEIVKN